MVIAASLIVAPVHRRNSRRPAAQLRQPPAAGRRRAPSRYPRPPRSSRRTSTRGAAKPRCASIRRHKCPAWASRAPLVIKIASPSFSLVTIDAPGAPGVSSQGYDGTVGWSDNPMTGPTLTTGKRSSSSQLHSNLHADLDVEKHFAKVECGRPRDLFAGEPCFKVALTTHGGIEMFNYFSVATGLMLGSSHILGGTTRRCLRRGRGERLRGVRTGNLYPTQTTQKAMGAEQVLTITEMDFSAIDPVSSRCRSRSRRWPLRSRSSASARARSATCPMRSVAGASIAAAARSRRCDGAAPRPALARGLALDTSTAAGRAGRRCRWPPPPPPRAGRAP